MECSHYETYGMLAVILNSWLKTTKTIKLKLAVTATTRPQVHVT